MYGPQTSSERVQSQDTRNPHGQLSLRLKGDVRRNRCNVLSSRTTPHKAVSVPLIPLLRATLEVVQCIVDQPEEESRTEIEQHPAIGTAEGRLILRRYQKARRPTQKYMNGY